MLLHTRNLRDAELCKLCFTEIYAASRGAIEHCNLSACMAVVDCLVDLVTAEKHVLQAQNLVCDADPSQFLSYNGGVAVWAATTIVQAMKAPDCTRAKQAHRGRGQATRQVTALNTGLRIDKVYAVTTASFISKDCSLVRSATRSAQRWCVHNCRSSCSASAHTSLNSTNSSEVQSATLAVLACAKMQVV